MMSGGIGIPAGPAMVLALGLLLCSCSVKEDRRACPCYVRIEVGEAQKVKGVRVRDVKVYYRYVGNVDEAMVDERREQYEQAV